MTTEYNVWVVVEKIDQSTEDNGTDTTVKKLASFDDETEAFVFANRIE